MIRKNKYIYIFIKSIKKIVKILFQSEKFFFNFGHFLANTYTNL